jgi:poly-beta-1,6-N-acetyl-D-glucosamine synthase
MIDFSHGMYLLIALLSLLNFARVTAMLIGADIYDLRQMRRMQQPKKRAYRPLITVIIPAYNEEAGVIRTVQSVLQSRYTNMQLIVVDDGSKDKTYAKLRNFQRRHRGALTVVRQQNAGKAAAINRAVTRHAQGSLVMVVDADSLLHKDAITNMVAHFRDRRVLASAANVKIIPSRTVLGIAQQFEYLISYRMKRALTVANMEYIVGGVGSTFRRSALLRAGLYDTDTMTEDIDLTVKLIHQYGNKKYKINYAADAIAYTDHVLRFKSLIKQRYRWKYGRFQTLIKHRNLFLNNSKKYDKRLTWYQLPYALVGEFVLLLEPLLVGYILYVVFRYADITSMVSVYAVVTAFVFLMVSGEETETYKTKLCLIACLPAVYILMYILTAVEFAALVQSLRASRALFGAQQSEVSWDHVERSGKPIVI